MTNIYISILVLSGFYTDPLVGSIINPVLFEMNALNIKPLRYGWVSEILEGCLGTSVNGTGSTR